VNTKDFVEDFPPSESPDDVDMNPRGGQGDDFPSDIENDSVRVPGQPDVEDHESVLRTRTGDIRSIQRDSKTNPDDSRQTEWMRQPNEDFTGVPDEDISFEQPGQLNSVLHLRHPNKGSPMDSEVWTRIPSQEIPEVAIDDDDVASFDKPGDARSIRRDAIPPQQNAPETDWARHPNQRSLVSQTKKSPLTKSLGRNYDWERIPSEQVPGVSGYGEQFNKPGEVTSVPRDSVP
jgi:hypothetical protein